MKTIALSGKGGTGKSTISTLIIHWISTTISKSILAVDADANVNLNDLLGVSITDTIGSIREEMKTVINNLPGGMTKQQFLDFKIQSSLIETPDFDLIAMGCPEGPGCYCYSNNLLRDILKTLSANYEFVIIDNEAGMEHLSRRIAQDIDFLLIVSDPIIRGIHAAGKISRLVEDLKINIKEKYLILNRVQDNISIAINECIKSEGLKLICSIPEDEILSAMDNNGKAAWPLITDTKAYVEIDKLMRKLLMNKQ